MSEPTWLEHAKALYDSSNHTDGDILSHDWIKFALQVPEVKTLEDAEEVQWILMSRLDAFRHWLLVERKTALQSVRGKGYWIVPPSEQARVAAVECMKQVRKGLQTADKVLSHARLDAMSDSERQRHTDTQVRLSGIGQMMTRQRRDVFALFKQE